MALVPRKELSPEIFTPFKKLSYNDEALGSVETRSVFPKPSILRGFLLALFDYLSFTSNGWSVCYFFCHHGHFQFFLANLTANMTAAFSP
jgi:hypothetical protein